MRKKNSMFYGQIYEKIVACRKSVEVQRDNVKNLYELSVVLFQP